MEQTTIAYLRFKGQKYFKRVDASPTQSLESLAVAYKESHRDDEGWNEVVEATTDPQGELKEFK